MKQLSDEVLTQVRAAFVKAEDCIQAMTDGPHHGDWGDTLDVLEKAIAALDAAGAAPTRAQIDCGCADQIDCDGRCCIRVLVAPKEQEFCEHGTPYRYSCDQCDEPKKAVWKEHLSNEVAKEMQPFYEMLAPKEQK